MDRRKKVINPKDYLFDRGSLKGSKKEPIKDDFQGAWSKFKRDIRENTTPRKMAKGGSIDEIISSDLYQQLRDKDMFKLLFSTKPKMRKLFNAKNTDSFGRERPYGIAIGEGRDIFKYYYPIQEYRDDDFETAKKIIASFYNEKFAKGGSTGMRGRRKETSFKQGVISDVEEAKQLMGKGFYLVENNTALEHKEGGYKKISKRVSNFFNKKMAKGGDVGFNEDMEAESYFKSVIKNSDFYELGDGYSSSFKNSTNKKGDKTNGEYTLEGKRIFWTYIDSNGREYSSDEQPAIRLDMRNYIKKDKYAKGGKTVLNQKSKNLRKKKYFQFLIVKWDETGNKLLEKHKMTVQRATLSSAREVVRRKYPKRGGYFDELDKSWTK